MVQQIQYKDQTLTFPKPKPWGVRAKSYGRYYGNKGDFKIANQSPNPRYKNRRPLPISNNTSKPTFDDILKYKITHLKNKTKNINGIKKYSKSNKIYPWWIYKRVRSTATFSKKGFKKRWKKSYFKKT